MSWSNFVLCPPSPQIGVLSELSKALRIGKSHMVRDLVCMAAVALSGAVFGQKLLHKM